jgi:actin-related protein 9
VKNNQPEARVSDYLVGSTLDEALANGESLEVYWPFAEAKIANWNQAEAIWYALSYTARGD